MAVGKNKKLGKKKGGKRKITDPFSKKEWYYVRAPGAFSKRDLGRTIATKSSGNKMAKDSLIGRVFSASLGDLIQDSEDEAFRKFKLRVLDVQGKYCMTYFHGMTLTTDKLRSLVRKWHSLIEAFVDIKTSDGFPLRLFCIGFTRARPNQLRKTSYAQSSQVRKLRTMMINKIKAETKDCSLNELVLKLIPGTIGKEVEKVSQGIYPLHNVFIRKVKVLHPLPKIDISKLMEAHGGVKAYAALGKKVQRPAETETETEEKEEEPMQE